MKNASALKPQYVLLKIRVPLSGRLELLLAAHQLSASIVLSVRSAYLFLFLPRVNTRSRLGLFGIIIFLNYRIPFS